MKNFDSKEYAWIDVKVILMGKEVGGLRGIAYKSKRQTEALYAAGKKARGIQRGKKEYEGTITLLQSELIALNNVAKQKGFDDISDIEFDAVVAYAPEGGVISTDMIIGIAVTEVPTEIKEGDLYQEIALPFIALDTEYNVA